MAEPACLHPQAGLRTRFPARDYLTGDAFEIQACEACGQALTRPVPSDPGRYYPDAYYGTPAAGRFPALVEWLQARLYRSRVKGVERFRGRRGGRVLDFGCGPGGLLLAFQQAGWDVQGIERSEPAARHARDTLGLPVHSGPLDTLPEADGDYDVVLLWHVLEHVPDPVSLLRQLDRRLRPGGLFLIGVPDFGSPEARFSRAGWFHLDVPRHLVHFTSATLDSTLAAAGHRIVAQRRFSLEFDLFSFLQSAENRLGLPPNLLYRTLRRSGARLDESSVSVPATVLAVTLAFPLALFGVPLVLLLGLMRKGSSLHVLTRSGTEPGRPGRSAAEGGPS